MASRMRRSSSDLNRKILAFRDVVQNPNVDPRPLAQELYTILFGNMAEDLWQAKVQTNMWSLDGTLRYVPLTALYDGRQYLIGQYRLSVFTPASNARLKDRPDARWTGGGFGASKAHEGAAALPGMISELAGDHSPGRRRAWRRPRWRRQDRRSVYRAVDARRVTQAVHPGANQERSEPLWRLADTDAFGV